MFGLEEKASWIFKLGRYFEFIDNDVECNLTDRAEQELASRIALDIWNRATVIDGKVNLSEVNRSVASVFAEFCPVLMAMKYSQFVTDTDREERLKRIAVICEGMDQAVSLLEENARISIQDGNLVFELGFDLFEVRRPPFSAHQYVGHGIAVLVDRGRFVEGCPQE